MKACIVGVVVVLMVLIVTDRVFSQNQMEIEGSIIISDNGSDMPQEGMIRWNKATEQFEGYNGSKWVVFSTQGSLWGAVPANEENAIISPNINYNVNNIEAGASVAIYGDWMMVRVPGADTIGGVAVYRNLAGKPLEVGILYPNPRPPSNLSDPRFGSAIDLDGDYMVVGAPGANMAYIFYNDNATWIQQAILDPGVSFDDFDAYGSSVAIAGNLAFVSVQFLGMDKGRIYIFERVNTTWTFLQYIEDTSGTSMDDFGSDIDAQGNLLVVGASQKGTNGEVLIYAPQLFNVWGLELTLKDSSSSAFNSSFGSSVSISGNTIVIGAPLDNVSRGKVHVFRNSFFTWNLLQELTLENPENGDNFGKEVANYNDYIVCGTSGRTVDNGTVYVFHQANNMFQQQSILTSSEYVGLSELFGFSLTIHSGNIVVGAPNFNHSGLISAGKAYLFRK